MASSRSRSSKNDWRRFRKFEQENEKLRKEISKLRKLVNSVVVDQLENKASRVKDGEKAYVPICVVCGEDKLHIVSINRPDGEFEIKVCTLCNHRHPMKKLKNESKEIEK